jgi:phage RecT family recombinase
MSDNLPATLKATMDKMSVELEKLLPENVPVEKFKRISATAILKDPKLMQADQRVLFTELSKCAQDGLYPDGREAAILIYKGRPAYLPMVGGILKRLRNTRELKSITAEIIRKNDTFKYWVDDQGPHVLFEPNLFSDRGEKIGVFCVAYMLSGGVYVSVMNKEQLKKIKNSSPAQNGPWATWEDEMELKTVIRRTSKLLPLSSELVEVIARDDDFYELNNEEKLPEIKSVKDIKEEEPKCDTEDAPKELSQSTSPTLQPAPLKTPSEEKPKSKKSKDSETKEITAAELKKAILDLSKELGWDGKKLAEWVQNNFMKSPAALDQSELMECANILAEFVHGKDDSQ